MSLDFIIQQVIAFLKDRQYKEADQLLKNELEKNPDNDEIHYYLSVSNLQQNKLEDALQHISKALFLKVDNAHYLSERGVIYYHMGKKDMSLKDMDQALRLEPQNPYRYSSRAYIKDSIGDIEGAISDYEMAIALDPDDAVAYNNLGLLQEKLGYREKAKSNFEKADEISKEWNFIDDNADSNPSLNIQSVNESENNPTQNNSKNAMDHLRIMKNVFTDKETFKEFTRFWKNKFKKKSN